MVGAILKVGLIVGERFTNFRAHFVCESATTKLPIVSPHTPVGDSNEAPVANPPFPEPPLVLAAFNPVPATV